MLRGITVSVVIPAFNVESFVGDAIESVLDQDFRNLQVIVVDDGSTDGTADVVSAFRDPRLTLVRGPNRGVAAARNSGLELSTGELIAFLDADDVWFATKLSQQAALLLSDDRLGCCGCFMAYITPSGKMFGQTGMVVDARVMRDVAEGRLMPFPISSILFRTRLVQMLGGFDPTLARDIPGLVEDLDLLSRLARESTVGSVESVLGAYRVHPAAASASHFASQRMGIRFVEARRAAESQGRTLDWAQFAATYRPGLRRRQIDAAAARYRRAGLHFAEERLARALWSLLIGTVIDPTYTVRRLARQRPWQRVSRSAA